MPEAEVLDLTVYWIGSRLSVIGGLGSMAVDGIGLPVGLIAWATEDDEGVSMVDTSRVVGLGSRRVWRLV